MRYVDEALVTIARHATQRAAVMEIGPKSVDSLYGGERLVAERIKS